MQNYYNEKFVGSFVSTTLELTLRTGTTFGQATAFVVNIRPGLKSSTRTSKPAYEVWVSATNKNV